MLEAINNVELPDFNFKNGHVYNNSIQVNELASDFLLQTDSNKNTITLSVQNLKATFKSS